MDQLNFKHLYYFYVVAKEGSIKASAEKLHVSQPTISDQIRLLEEYFGGPLFERKNRSLVLNRSGDLALKYAERIFSLSQEVTSRLRHNVEAPKRQLDIGITNHMSQYFLYDTLMPLFAQEEVSISIKEGERHLLLADLEEGRLDLVFTDNRESISAVMDSYRVGVNRTFVVAHKKYRSCRRNFPEGLNNIPFFNYTSDSTLKFEIDLFFSKNGLAPRVIGEADDVNLFQVVTEQGLAFTIVPEVAKSRFCLNKDIIVLGELTEFQASVWGVVKKADKGLGYRLLANKL
jgi:LysR family transcriptional activator of nhaA